MRASPVAGKEPRVPTEGEALPGGGVEGVGGVGGGGGREGGLPPRGGEGEGAEAPPPPPPSDAVPSGRSSERRRFGRVREFDRLNPSPSPPASFSRGLALSFSSSCTLDQSTVALLPQNRPKRNIVRPEPTAVELRKRQCANLYLEFAPRKGPSSSSREETWPEYSLFGGAVIRGFSEERKDSYDPEPYRERKDDLRSNQWRRKGGRMVGGVEGDEIPSSRRPIPARFRALRRKRIEERREKAPLGETRRRVASVEGEKMATRRSSGRDASLDSRQRGCQCGFRSIRQTREREVGAPRKRVPGGNAVAAPRTILEKRLGAIGAASSCRLDSQDGRGASNSPFSSVLLSALRTTRRSRKLLAARGRSARARPNRARRTPPRERNESGRELRLCPRLLGFDEFLAHSLAREAREPDGMDELVAGSVSSVLPLASPCGGKRIGNPSRVNDLALPQDRRAYFRSADRNFRTHLPSSFSRFLAAFGRFGFAPSENQHPLSGRGDSRTDLASSGRATRIIYHPVFSPFFIRRSDRRTTQVSLDFFGGAIRRPRRPKIRSGLRDKKVVITGE
ncbi:hypothetical protein KM043_006251 [Ampulex compressa]|nr:hypothetical protein KM043_006251 [Ampulex compressa]